MRSASGTAEASGNNGIVRDTAGAAAAAGRSDASPPLTASTISF